jgi:hypothetical protein
MPRTDFWTDFFGDFKARMAIRFTVYLGRTVPRRPGRVKCNAATPQESSLMANRRVLFMACEAL